MLKAKAGAETCSVKHGGFVLQQCVWLSATHAGNALAGSVMGVLSNGQQLSQSTRTDGPHGSITFAAGADYSYTGVSTTSKALSFLISMEDNS